MSNTRWSFWANCKNLDARATDQIFYNGRSQGSSPGRPSFDGPPRWSEARSDRYCRNCLVLTECLEMAVSAEGPTVPTYRHGYFGNKSPEQRFKIATDRLAEDIKQAS